LVPIKEMRKILIVPGKEGATEIVLLKFKE